MVYTLEIANLLERLKTQGHGLEKDIKESEKSVFNEFYSTGIISSGINSDWEETWGVTAFGKEQLELMSKMNQQHIRLSN